MEDLHQSGSLKALFPHGRRDDLQAVFLNTAGGITGGDRFEISARAGVGAALTLTSQAAERLYRAQPGETGRVVNRFRLARAARLDWVPQETIVFDGADVSRRTEVEMAPDARLLLVEPVVMGRLAMGEIVKNGYLRDVWRVKRADELIFADNLSISGASDEILARPGTGAGARAFATLLLAGEDADLLLAPLRAVLGRSGGASVIRPGLLFARMVAEDGYVLRKTLLPAIKLLSGREIPRTWML
ncbi:urease accessory protein UreD [Pseudooceanicola aestuarii]|uniref:urease accessory protein UreD n=1 Tax=Pseudooceanicola aestuarii TaxID=2697319 RepID=UPI001EF91BC3|nr:urease accessory protein UreD [Pseudooceanicola aestuarii]